MVCYMSGCGLSCSLSGTRMEGVSSLERMGPSAVGAHLSAGRPSIENTDQTTLDRSAVRHS